MGRRHIMPNKSKRFTGISISTQKVAVAQIITNSSGRVAIKHLEIADIPQSAKEEGRIAEETISQIISDLFADNEIKSIRVSLAIPGNSVITRMQTLPCMPENEIREVLKGEVENYALLEGGEAVISFQEVEQRLDGITQRSDILYTAAPKETVNTYKEISYTADIKLRSIGSIPQAVITNITDSQINPQESRKPMMIIIIEETSGTIAITQNGKVKFIRSIDSGSTRIYEESKSLEVLIHEVRSSLRYYQQAYPQREKTEKVIILANNTTHVQRTKEIESQSDYISRILSGYLDIPVVGADTAMTMIEVSDDNIRHRMKNYSLSAYSAIGAANMAKSENNAGIDLLNPNRAEIAKLKNRMLMILTSVLLMALLGLTGSIFFKAKADSIKQRLISQNHSDVFDMQIIEDIDNIRENIAKLTSHAGTGKAVIKSANHISWAEIFHEISANIPKTVWLTEITWTSEKDAVFRGVALSYESVIAFKEKLEKLAHYESVRLNSMEKSRTGVESTEALKFEMFCQPKKKTS
jgi:Tfp pilus assembly PilM family ATPase/Tfp pilus assembly protein PilN